MEPWRNQQWKIQKSPTYDLKNWKLKQNQKKYPEHQKMKAFV